VNQVLFAWRVDSRKVLVSSFKEIPSEGPLKRRLLESLKLLKPGVGKLPQIVRVAQPRPTSNFPVDTLGESKILFGPPPPPILEVAEEPWGVIS